MRLFVTGLLVLVGSWLPLMIVGLGDPAANPIGLGLLGMLGTAVATGLLGVATVRRLRRLLSGG
jgi:hypothetical protein